jgi:hypothetical protein
MHTVHEGEECDQVAHLAALLATDWYTVSPNVSCQNPLYIQDLFCTSKRDVVENRSAISASNNDFINCQSQVD